jgi:hypothetical protein
MKMTPEQKIKWAILNKNALWAKKPMPKVTAENIDDLYENEECTGDAEDEIRGGEVNTKLDCETSRHYESNAVAALMPDGSWVGWTYWYGGGKHSDPDSIDWMDESYDIEIKEKEVTKMVRTFTKI